MRLLIIILFLAACTNDAAPGTDSGTVHAKANDTLPTAAPVVLNGCYVMTLKRDSATLDLSVEDTTVSGTLNYIFYEKDHNNGAIKGVLRNDTIYADYTFESEGLTSVREVIFKVSGDTLIPAYGELSERDGKIVFSNKEAINFTDPHPFVKVPCPQ